jgi:C1A family cysteine protease
MTEKQRKQGFGWIPDKKDSRDFIYRSPIAIALPKRVNLESDLPPVYDQGDLGSCVLNAGAANIYFVHKKNCMPIFNPSRLFMYYDVRELEGAIYEDSGCSIRDAIKCVAKDGVCDEEEWPYNISRFTEKPTTHCYTDALLHRIVSYHRISTILNDMKSCLAEGYPFIMGVTIYENFPMETSTGIIPMPSGQSIGGHAMLVVGYDDDMGRFIIRNSWGEKWGDKGYGYIPYEYLTNPMLGGDYWTIRGVLSESLPEAKTDGGFLYWIKLFYDELTKWWAQ